MIKFRKESVEFGFLSNFYPGGFEAGGAYWPTVEHFFQAMKSLKEGERSWVRASPSPAVAKKRGREITLRPKWNTLRVEVMRWALERKFRDLVLRTRLLETGTKILIEDSPWDSFWGCGKNGKGKNTLGKLLMELRNTLRLTNE